MERRKRQPELYPDPYFGLTDEFNRLAHEIARLSATVGPNEWEKITKSDFSFSFDYIVQPLDPKRVIIDPTSNAALQWLYKHLPQDCPRYGTLGFIVEKKYAPAILERMNKDGLFSEAEYVCWMENEERDRHQGENR